MSPTRHSIGCLLGDARRLIAPLDVLYTLGKLIYRRALRYTLLTVGVSILGMVAKSFGLLPGFTVKQAILLPLLIGGLSVTVGVLLKVVPSLIASRLLTVAQASDLNLMEDYRKSQGEAHLQQLWQRLFRHEVVVNDPAVDYGNIDAAEKHRLDFLARAREALASHLPQIQQMHSLGLDLRYFEDWRDGGYLDRSDAKLVQQFDGNSTLLDARCEARLSGLGWSLRFSHRRTLQKFWFLFLTRIVAIQVATEVQKLNKAFDTDLFNSQVLLWPGTENSAWLERYPGAREQVLRRRRRVIRRVFGDDDASARRVLDHMLTCCVAAATELRYRYDPDYCDGTLGYDVLEDVRREGTGRRDARVATAAAAEACGLLKRLGQFVRAHRDELLAPDRAADFRAVRISAILPKGEVRGVLDETPDDPAAVNAAIDRAIDLGETRTRRLLAVRMHHELTRLCRAGYHELVITLGYGDQAAP